MSIYKYLNSICGGLNDMKAMEYLEHRTNNFMDKHHLTYNKMNNLVGKYQIEIVNSINKKDFNNNYKLKVGYLFGILENKYIKEYNAYHY